MSILSRPIRSLVLTLARTLGSTITDAETGAVIGRALLLPWRGKIAIIGLDAEVKPVFLPQARLTYWKQNLGFTLLPPPDFPHEPHPQSPPHSPTP